MTDSGFPQCLHSVTAAHAARPRFSGFARSLASGVRSWPVTEVNPTVARAVIGATKVGAIALAARTKAEQVIINGTSFRRSIMSPRGTIRKTPIA